MPLYWMYKIGKNFHPELVNSDHKFRSLLNFVDIAHEIDHLDFKVFHKIDVRVQVTEIVKIFIKAW